MKVNGRIAPFLELGVGFQGDLTAEDNVRLYGAIMGMTKQEMENKFEEIFEFPELGRFRNMKLKNFSSGMYARLAFATAVAELQPKLGNKSEDGISISLYLYRNLN